MRILPFSLFLIPLLLPVLGQAEESCPWLDAPTANAALGTTTTGTVTLLDKNQLDTDKIGDSICEFTKQRNPLFRQLRIEVRTVADPAQEFITYTAHCSSKPSPVKAVGNEALACALEAKSGQVAEQIIGRLRDRIFVVTLWANESWVSHFVLLAKTYSVTDQVSGAMY
jgi:hypothetical protein